MQFYINTHQHYCGIDLHAKTMYLCILDSKGEDLLHKNSRSRPEDFVRAIAPFREDLVVGVRCMFTWYLIHGGKVKNDEVDAFKIAMTASKGHPRAGRDLNAGSR